MNVMVVLMRKITYTRVDGILLNQAIQGLPSRISLTGRLLWRLVVEERNDDLPTLWYFDPFGRTCHAIFPYTFDR